MANDTEIRAKFLAEKLVDWVSTVTQLDPDKGELANVDDWRRCAEKLFAQELRSVPAKTKRARS